MSPFIDSEQEPTKNAYADGTGPAYTLIQEGLERGVTKVALIGYSHGAGVVYNVANRLQDDFGINPFNRLVFTAYIDAIKKGGLLGDWNFFAEDRRPPGSEHHLNWYQNAFFRPTKNPLHGVDIPGAENHELTAANASITPVGHLNVDDQTVVKNSIIETLGTLMPVPL